MKTLIIALLLTSPVIATAVEVNSFDDLKSKTLNHLNRRILAFHENMKCSEKAVTAKEGEACVKVLAKKITALNKEREDFVKGAK